MKKENTPRHLVPPMYKACTVAIVTIIVLWPGASRASTCDTMPVPPKATDTLGIYIESLYNFSMADYSVKANLWLWLVSPADPADTCISAKRSNDSIKSLDRLSKLQFTNAKDFTFSDASTTLTKVNDTQYCWWACEYCHVNLYEKWELTHYPFCKQRLQLIFESGSDDTTALVIVHDPKNESSAFIDRRQLDSSGWKLGKVHIADSIHLYASDFGNPAGDNTSHYSRIYYNLSVSQKLPVKWHIFWKLNLVIFIAFFVAWISFFVSPEEIDSRLALGVGALFAAVVDKYTIDGNLPKSAPDSFIDAIHVAAFVTILIPIAVSIFAHYRISPHKNNRPEIEKVLKALRKINFPFAAFTLLLFAGWIAGAYYLHGVGR